MSTTPSGAAGRTPPPEPAAPAPSPLRRLTGRRAGGKAPDPERKRQRKQERKEQRKQEREALRRDLRDARKELALVSQQRDAAVAELSRSGDLQYLFVVTYGRSGSTLLAGILSAIPGYLIRGENDQVGQELFEFYQRLTAARDKHGKHSGSPTDPWWGIGGYSDEIVLARIRELLTVAVLRPQHDTRVVGYKEIGWWFEGGVDYIDFLRQVFPGAKFVLNTRNHEDVARSKWWNDATHPLVVLREREQMMDQLVERFGDDVYRVHYDDYVEDPAVLRGLFEWLGEPFDEERVRDVLSVQHSY